VHFVTDRITRQPLVIKQLKCRQDNGEFRQPFEAEIVSQHLAPHPNIMGVKAVHIAEDGVHLPYANVVMEHCEAGDLCDFIAAFKYRGTQVPAPFIMHFASSMIDALAFIHHGHTDYDSASERPVVANPEQPAILHRDIKPDNIFLQWRESLKYGMPDIILADFGLAAFESDNVGIRGTTKYFAPEVHDADIFASRSRENEDFASRSTVCSKASDMYSFALTLFELMTLRHYRSGEDIEAAFKNSNVSEHIEILALLQSCLVEEPEDRQLADACHFVSHALKKRLQVWEDRGERVPDYVWPASFQSRDGIALASSVYSDHSYWYGSTDFAVAGASSSSASSEEISDSEKAAADLEQMLAAMCPS
jgi:serine/threonine protein kinase